jgi:hypothetical protein
MNDHRKENFMNANIYKTNCTLRFKAMITFVLCCTLVVRAQDPGQLKEMFARSQQQNAQALKQYSWKSRNEVRKNNESKSTQVFLMRYDLNGNLQKSQIGGSQASLPKGPFIGRIAQKKKEEMVELVDEIRQQVQAYSQLPPEKMQAFLASATITTKMDQGQVLIQGNNILSRGDSMSIWFDARTRKQRQIEIVTFLDRYPVKALIEFNNLPGGPTYMARTVVDYAKESLQLVTENFDYQREGRGDMKPISSPVP